METIRIKGTWYFLWIFRIFGFDKFFVLLPDCFFAYQAPSRKRVGLFHFALTQWKSLKKGSILNEKNLLQSWLPWKCINVETTFLRRPILAHICRVDSPTLTLRTGLFPIKGVSGQFLLLPCFIEIPVFNANSVDPDQTPRFASCDLGLHCLSKCVQWFYSPKSFFSRCGDMAI